MNGPGLNWLSGLALVGLGLLLPGQGRAAAWPACPLEAAHLPALSPGPGRSAVACALLLEPSAPMGQRLGAVSELGPELSHDSLLQLFAFLKRLPNPQETNPAALNLLKNNLVSCLQGQLRPPEGLSAILLDIVGNPRQDPVARDYALQHLISWSEQGPADALQARSSIQESLWQVSREESSLAGTALLGLHRLEVACQPSGLLEQPGRAQPAGPGLFDTAISLRALQLLTATNQAGATRLSALQVCAERELSQALPLAQSLAQAPQSIALRIGAISALGWLGGPEQMVLLQRLQTEANPALRPALQGALRRLGAKLLQNPAITQNSL